MEGWGIAKPKMIGLDKPLRRSRQVHFFTGYDSLCMGWKWRGNGDRLRPTLTDNQILRGAFCAKCEMARETLEKDRAVLYSELNAEDQ